MIMKEVLRRFLLAVPPLVKTWLEETFVELSHGSESCSPVEEVKLLVLLIRLQRRIL